MVSGIPPPKLGHQRVKPFVALSGSIVLVSFGEYYSKNLGHLAQREQCASRVYHKQ